MIVNNKIKIYVIAGPTSSGKSDKAVELALEINGEVISADSRQVYRGLDVGTGKITTEEMKGIKHHCLDIVDPGERFSVSDWLIHARAAIDGIVSRGKVPIVCGGTGFYIDAIIYGLPENSGPNLKLREELGGLDIFSLQIKYKASADLFINSLPQERETDHLDIKNKRRLIRAIEIQEYNKSNGSVFQKRNREPLYDVEWIMIDIDKETLKENIKVRCIKRLDNIITETKSLLASGDHEWLSSIGIEYKQIILFLENNNKEFLESKISVREELIEKIVNKSWQYAKRQMTWNRKYCK